MSKKPAKKRRQNPDKPLTNQMLMFVREYIACDFVGHTAAINAGYSPAAADQQASRLLRMAKVQEEIQVQTEARRKRLSIDADKLLLRWIEEYDADVAELFNDDGSLKNAKDWPQIWRKGLVAGVKSKELWEGEGDKRKLVGYTREVKLSDRHERGMSIGRHIAVQAFKDVHVHKLGDPEAELAASLMGDRIMPRPQAALPAPAALPQTAAAPSPAPATHATVTTPAPVRK